MKIRLGLAVLLIVGGGLVLSCGKDKNSTNPTPGPTMPEQGLQAYYPFTNGADDMSSNNNDGTLLGGATANGYLSIGRNLTDALSLPRRVLDGMEDLTISSWLRIDTLQTSIGAANIFISAANGSGPNALLFYYVSGDDAWRLFINNNGRNFEQDIVIKDLKWHHVAVMRSGALARLYIDGNEVGSGISVYTDSLDIDLNRLIVGQYEPGHSISYSWAGDIDNLRFYDRALSEAEVQQLANEAHSGN